LKNGGIFCYETLTGALKFYEFPLKLTKDTWTLVISPCVIIKHKKQVINFDYIMMLLFSLQDKSLKFHARMFMASSAQVTKELYTCLGGLVV